MCWGAFGLLVHRLGDVGCMCWVCCAHSCVVGLRVYWGGVCVVFVEVCWLGYVVCLELNRTWDGLLDLLIIVLLPISSPPITS